MINVLIAEERAIYIIKAEDTDIFVGLNVVAVVVGAELLPWDKVSRMIGMILFLRNAQ